jgi:soluble lytic murein transglycosylase
LRADRLRKLVIKGVPAGFIDHHEGETGHRAEDSAARFFVEVFCRDVLNPARMLRFLRNLLITLALAAATAAGLLLWLSPDPQYTAQEWLAGGRYYDFDLTIRDLGQKHDLDPALLKAIVWRESAFHPEKVGSSGERGLMQVSEAAARDWAGAVKRDDFVPTDLFDARTNLEVGAWYFKRALERWKSKEQPLPFALAEYNAGRTRVDRWIAATNMGGQANADDLLGAIDYPTTRRYIDEITRRYQFYRERGRL